MIGHYLLFILVGIILFAIGLATGWEMYKSVQEERNYQYRVIVEELQNLRNKVSK